MSIKSMDLNGELFWNNLPLDFNHDSENSFYITSGAGSNLFNSPAGKREFYTCPMLLFKQNRDFTLSARLKVEFKETFDAGILLLYINNDYWAKLCLEYSPDHKPMIVSVVNKGVSDDSNCVNIEKNEIYLRVSRMEHAFAFHYSFDNNYWHLVRFFTLGHWDSVNIGFASQSPNGQSCQTSFDEIQITNRRLENIRSGE